MSRSSSRNYWIVKHGLDALTVLPNFIWRTGETKEPSVFRQVKKGDRWIGFAYTTSDARERPLSQVTGFFECVSESKYDRIPDRARCICRRQKKAWLVRGVKFGWQPDQPVGVPSIGDMLPHRSFFNQATLLKVSREEFEEVRRQTKARQLNPKKIPVLQREPRGEQEVLAIVVGAATRLGIERFLRIRTAFPDVTVKLRGKAEPVHLELEVYSRSFLAHGHGKQLKRADAFSEDVNGCTVNRPLAVVCWIDDAKPGALARAGRVSRVFELQRILREDDRLRWARV